ncbi:MAG: PD40 domain-containing protein [Anaerolineae bacterium]|nr:PD40 domain-containing protein [Anaerolineae bacterium]
MRRAFLLIAAAILALVILVYATSVHAQNIDPIIDAVIADMAWRTGYPLNRNNTNYTFEQSIYPDLSLGCPQPGVVYAPSPTLGWKIELNPGKTNIFYDYRAVDATRFFLCSAKGEFPTRVPPPTAAPVEPTAVPVVPGTTAPGEVVPAPTRPAGQVSAIPTTTYEGPVIAYVDADGEVAITSMGINPGPTPLTMTAKGKRTTDAPFYALERQYGSLQWSPDGNTLLFGDSTTGGIYIARSGQPAIQITNKAAFPMWSPDGKQIAYAVQVDRDNLGKVQYDVMAAPTEGGAPGTVARFFQDCATLQPAPGAEPANNLYAAEISSRASTVAWTPNGFVYTPSCAGIGLALVGADNKEVWRVPDVAHVAIAPDRTKAVGVKVDSAQVLFIDLASGVVNVLPTKPGVDQLAWTADSAAILYSTTTPTQTAQGDPNAKLGTELFPVWPLTAQAYTVSLWRVPLTGGDSVMLFSQEGRGIGNIAATPDGKLVTFSFISSGLPFIQAVNAGQPRDAALALLPTLKIGVTTLTPGADTQAGFPYFFDEARSGWPAFSSAAKYTAVPTPGSTRVVAAAPTSALVIVAPTVAQTAPAVVVAPTTNAAAPTTAAGNTACGPLPTRLVKGQQGRVTPGPDNSLNNKPAPPSKDPTSQAIGTIPAGTVFTVLDGPVCGYNLTWWQLKVDANGVIGWTAEGDASGYWLEPLQPAQPTAVSAASCPGNLPQRLAVGKAGRVVSAAGNALNSQPSAPSKDPNSKRLGTIPPKGVFTVVEGPTCAGGYTWWKVNFNGTTGWTPEGDTETYWLEPIASETVG